MLILVVIFAASILVCRCIAGRQQCAGEVRVLMSGLFGCALFGCVWRAVGAAADAHADVLYHTKQGMKSMLKRSAKYRKLAGGAGGIANTVQIMVRICSTALPRLQRGSLCLPCALL